MLVCIEIVFVYSLINKKLGQLGFI